MPFATIVGPVDLLDGTVADVVAAVPFDLHAAVLVARRLAGS